MAAHPGWHPFSYLNNSYHRDADMDNMADCAVTLLFAPGAVQIFYGDETRRPLSDARLNVDSNQAFRSDMNWNSADTTLLDHFRRLGRIRKAHPVIGTGRQTTLDTHTCVRHNDTDTVMIRLSPEARKPIVTAPWFADGTLVEELYTGQKARVADGCITFPAYAGNVAVIARASGR